MPLTLKWKHHNKHFLIATHENFLWVMTKAVSGRPNRWNLVELQKQGSDLAKVLGRELPPGHCRKIANERLNENFPRGPIISEAAYVWDGLRRGARRALLDFTRPIPDQVARRRPVLNILIRECLMAYDEDVKTWDLTAEGRRVQKHGRRRIEQGDSLRRTPKQKAA